MGGRGGVCWPLHSLCMQEVGRVPTPWGDRGGQPTPWGWSRAWETYLGISGLSHHPLGPCRLLFAHPQRD